MNREELISAISESANVSKKDAAAALSALIETVTETVAKGDKVSLPGFGSFEARKRAARTGRNPLTGATLQIAAKTIPAFKAGKTFKDVVNEG